MGPKMEAPVPFQDAGTQALRCEQSLLKRMWVMLMLKALYFKLPISQVGMGPNSWFPKGPLLTGFVLC